MDEVEPVPTEPGGALPVPEGSTPLEEMYVAGDLVPAEVSTSRKRLGVGSWLAIIWLVFVLGAGFLHPLLVPSVLATPEANQPDMIRPDQRAPSAQHPFGGDRSARDVFSRTLLGGRDSMLLGVTAMAGALLIGGTIGLIAGYYGNRTDTALTSLLNIMLAMPQLILAMSLVFFLAGATASPVRQFWALSLALIVVGTPLIGRITRASTLQYSTREFVTASKALGAKNGRIMIREVLPNVLPAMLSITLLGVAIVIVAEGSLAILGLGLKTVSWGSVIAENQDQLKRYPQAVLFPALFIFLTVMSLNFLGDVVRSRFDVKELG